MICIYVLKHPETKEVKYVGKTKQKLYARLSAHKRYAKTTNKPTHTTNWINKLLQNNLNPIIECIEEVYENNWQEREKFWINHYRNQNIKLTNTQDGGQGAYGGLNTASFKGKIHTDETKKIISKKNKAIIKSKEWVKNAADAQCIPIYGIHIKTNQKISFDCIRDAALFIGDIKFRKNIHQCLKKLRPTAYKYKWFYKEIIDVKDKEL
ncbi:MAG: GIY-YIG nuclease family protein [Romboutsia sp.]|nr:GIY-YIG nuclease family protein [Romboutsia sp.]